MERAQRRHTDAPHHTSQRRDQRGRAERAQKRVWRVSSASRMAVLPLFWHLAVLPVPPFWHMPVRPLWTRRHRAPCCTCVHAVWRGAGADAPWRALLSSETIDCCAYVHIRVAHHRWQRKEVPAEASTAFAEWTRTNLPVLEDIAVRAPFKELPRLDRTRPEQCAESSLCQASSVP